MISFISLVLTEPELTGLGRTYFLVGNSFLLFFIMDVPFCPFSLLFPGPSADCDSFPVNRGDPTAEAKARAPYPRRAEGRPVFAEPLL